MSSNAPTPDDPAGHLPCPEMTEGLDAPAGVHLAPEVTPPEPPPASAPQSQRDAYWRKHVYLGDSQLQLTARAVLIGGTLGGLMSVTGLFITLKTGWGLGLTIIATLGSYSAMNALTKLSADRTVWQFVRAVFAVIAFGALGALWHFRGDAFNPEVAGVTVPVVKVVCGLLGAIAAAAVALWPARVRPFTMLENNCMGSTAVSASASTGMTIVGCFGGLLLVSDKNITNPPMLAMGAVVFFTALLGICLAVPLKRRMINEEDLPYPSPKAGAEMLKSLYADGRDGLIKARALFLSLGVGALVGLSRGLPQLAEAFGASTALKWMAAHLAIPEDFALPYKVAQKGGGDATLRGMAFEPSLLLTAVGLIVGMRVSLSMFAGSCLLYFWLTPMMYDLDQAWLVAHAADSTGFKAAMEVKSGAIAPTAWGLWGGTALLITSSFATLAFQWRTLARSFSGVFSKGEVKDDPVADLEVPMKWAVYMGVPCALGLMLSLWLGFGVNPALGVLALLVSCLVAVVCARTAAEADINPIGAMGKVTQLMYAVLPGAAGNAAINLVSAGSTSAAGGSAVDMLGDLKCSHLLGANPRRVWIAQMLGVFFGIVCVIPAWYYIVPDKNVLETKFNALPAQMWSAVAKFLTDPQAQFYHGAAVLMVVCAVLGVIIPLVSHRFPKAAKWMPSPLGLGLSLALPFANSLAFLLGATIMFLWEKGHRKSAAFFGLVIASGLMSGEAIVSSLVLLSSQIGGGH